MSRLENEFMKIGINGSGQYSGEVDYILTPHIFDKLSLEAVDDTRRLLKDLTRKCEEKLDGTKYKSSFSYKIWKIIDLKYLPIFSKNHQMWPIKLGWLRFGKNIPFITAHGWQTGWKNNERIFGWTLHIGSLKIKFGKQIIKTR